MRTSLREMLELSNFGQMKIIKCDKILLVYVKDRNYDVITFISKYLYFKKV